LELFHRPVLLQESVDLLITDLEGVYVDGTVGAGGHSLELAGRIGPAGRLLCLDRDDEALRIARDRLSSSPRNVAFFKASYSELDEVLRLSGIEKVRGILLDLGISSYQIERSGRGFSFGREDPLDMRMDPEGGTTAYDLVNGLPPEELKRILREYGEEKKAGRIAKAIERERKKGPIRTSLQLAELIRSVVPSSRRPGMKHPATRAFQALRIAVNEELKHLRVFLEKAPSLIDKEGRLAVIAYHSLEDRLVKRAMVEWEAPCTCPHDLPACVCRKVPLFRRVNKKGIKPGKLEIERNPRARSAVLRAAERI
jgi:16S rRNA (cytosine1402-N4)-methyltransferase